MTKNSSNILETEKIGKLIFMFAIPMIISQLITSVYNIVDQIFVGQSVGYLGNAATAVVFPIVNIGTAAALLFGSGAASNYSLNAGKKGGNILYCLGNGLSFMTIFSILLSGIIFVARNPLLILFGATAQSLAFASEYAAIIAAGLPFSIISVGGSLIIRAAGNPKYATIALAIGAIINCVLDPVFLFKLHMGMSGAALATVLGQLVSMVMVALYFRDASIGLTAKHFIPQWHYLKAILSLGIALAVNQIAISIINIIMNDQLRYYGTHSIYGSDIPIACVGIITKLSTLLISIQIGVAQGCQPINGFNYGAKQYERVQQTYKTAVVVLVTISTIFFAVFEIFPKQIIALFGNGSAEYFELAIKFLRYYMLFVVISGIQPISSNFLTSIGKAKKGTVLFLSKQIILLLPLIIILPLFWGIDGIIYAAPLSDLIAFIWSLFFMKKEFEEMTQLEKAKPVD